MITTEAILSSDDPSAKAFNAGYDDYPMERRYMFEHSTWFKPYVAGYYAWRYLDVMMSREQVECRLEALLALERVI